MPELGGIKDIYEKIRQYTLAHLADKDLKAALGVPGKLCGMEMASIGIFIWYAYCRLWWYFIDGFPWLWQNKRCPKTDSGFAPRQQSIDM